MPSDTRPPAYGAVERAWLSALAGRLGALNPGGMAIAAAVADILRGELPDLDDATIGRVILALTTGQMTAMWKAADSAPQAQAGLTAVGLHLTETEWKDPHAI